MRNSPEIAAPTSDGGFETLHPPAKLAALTLWIERLPHREEPFLATTASEASVLEFRLPDLGEGLAEANLVSWQVSVGDQVQLNQTIAEVETAKALVELPSPFSGTVTELMVEAGTTVPVGTPIIRVRSDREADPPKPDAPTVLFGYGPDAPRESLRNSPSGDPALHAHPAGGRPDAKPSARKLARQLGVELGEVPGSSQSGAVTVHDVRDYDHHHHAPDAPSTTLGAARAQPRETRTKITGVRKRTADSMVSSVRTIPQVSVFVDVDVTASIELLDHLRSTPSFRDLKLTPLALVAKTALLALAENPSINSSWDDEHGEIVTKHFVNLGIAVATPRGLLVPSIKEAHAMSLRELCREIGWLAETARVGGATPADLRGGTFSITNIGVFGVDTGSPLINPGEAAILCIGAIRKRPWVFRDELAVRWVSTLSLSFDHRLVDGEHGSKFLADMAAMLEDPLALLGRI